MHLRPGNLALAAVGLIGIAALGKASVILNVQSVSDAAGSTGDTLEVTLTNTGTAITVGGFSFGLSVGTSNLSFTAVTTGTTTATYIFNGQSLFGPDISVQPPNLPGQSLKAEDLAEVSATVVGSGATVGLGHITFNLAAATPAGGIPLNFIALDDSLADQLGSPIAFSTGTGTVTVTGSASIPEPATFVLVGAALAGLIVRWHGFRRRGFAVSKSANTR
jgi:hypothetical protein